MLEWGVELGHLSRGNFKPKDPASLRNESRLKNWGLTILLRQLAGGAESGVVYRLKYLLIELCGLWAVERHAQQDEGICKTLQQILVPQATVQLLICLKTACAGMQGIPGKIESLNSESRYVYAGGLR